MHKSQKSSTGGNAVFYKPVAITTEIRAGYLVKSPPPKRLKTEKSWKKRYFVLFKISEQEHQLKYFRNPGEKDRPLGGIDLSHISLLKVNPENHPKWQWIQKSFRCSPTCVLYIRAADRDYFLVGENRYETMDIRRSEITVKDDEQLAHAADREVEEVCTDGTLMRSCNQIFDKFKTQVSPLPTCDEEAASEDREEMRLTSDFSSSSSDNGAISSEEMLEGQNGHTFEKQYSTESLDTITPEERDIEIKQADVKKHLTLTQVDGKPCVEEFNMYMSKSLKNEVRPHRQCP
ncbi:Pleckstrin -like proteiny domain-containing family S member 1 [Collichthys lucidus]|uniref:Pleckstrin-like proteiny domain-containing family S member 1 n=1 Tax=Collichthys lucidus TaxID=240159 RepID=A0A4U5VM78_COLLU|nr:Pleckstrin -like proteiny domain-containing family S member 1 [Collichthys lucidus]